MGYALKHTKGKVGSKRRARGRRHLRVRRQVVGTPQRPRLVVTRSQRHVFVQVVDDSVGNTLASASTMEADLRAAESTKSEKRSEEHTSELQSRGHLVCRLLLEKKKQGQREGSGSQSVAPVVAWL